MLRNLSSTALFLLAICLLVGACAPAADQTGDAEAVSPAQAQQWLETLAYPDDDRDFERRLAAVQLGLSRYEPAAEELAKRLAGDIDLQTRAACAFALGRIGGDRAKDALLAALNDYSEHVQAAAINALAGMADQKVIKDLSNRMQLNNEKPALLMARVLLQAGVPAADVQNMVEHRHTQDVGPPPYEQFIYVDPDRGSDDNAGSESKPVKTIARGLELLERLGTLMIAGSARGAIREAVVVPQRLHGDSDLLTRIMAWPGKPRPLLQPTVAAKPDQFAKNKEGHWSLKIEKPIYGVFMADGGKVKIFPRAESKDKLQPGACWWEAGELLVDNGDKPFSGSLELAFAEDALRIERAGFVRVSGIDVRYAPDSGLDANGAWGASFLDCAVSYCDRHGIFVYYSPDSTVRDCRVQGCTYQGISVRSSPRTMISRCRSTDNGVDGLLFLYDSDSCVAGDNVIMRNRRAISFIEGSDFGRVVGNVIKDNQQNQVQSQTGSSGTYVAESR